MNRAELLVKAEQIAAYYGEGKQLKSDVDSWLTLCPAHDDSTPSLHITVTDRILVKCHGGCTQTAVINQLKADGMWVAAASKDKDTKPKVKNNINIPAHRVPDFDQILIGKERPTEIYSYVTEEGEPAFWILRLDRPGKPKVIRPYSSVHYDDGDRFELALNCTVRPLYRLDEIVSNPDKPIMVVEGEKTVRAAQAAFPEYIVTTWSGGSGGLTKSVWSPLKDRSVTLWPDNDDPGILAMNKIAAIINAANPTNVPQIVFDETIDDLPEGWDLADEADQDTHSPELLLSKAKPVDLDKLKSVAAQSVDAAEWIKKYAAKYIRVLESGALSFYNLQSMSAQMDGASPFVWINSIKTLHEVESTRVFDAFTQKPKFAVDYWLEDTSQPIAYGMVYDPASKEKLVNRDGTIFLNTFPGFAHEPIKCEEAKIAPFLNHIYEVLGDVELSFFLDYIAHMVQFIQQKPGVMIIFTGKPGVGKTIICDVIAHMLGRQNAVVVDSAAFTQSNFNGLFSGKLFVTINELNVAARRDHTLTGKIKAWITDENYTVNAKFKAQRNERSYHRFIATTNSDIPFPIDVNDRRIALFHVKDKFRDHSDHFKPIFKMLKDPEALSGLMHFFANHKIVNSVMRPPSTEATKLAFHAEDPVVDWMFNVLATGMFPPDVREKIEKSNDWVRYGVVIPRSVVVDSIIGNMKTTLSKNYVTMRMTAHAVRKTCPPGHENNQVRIDVYDRVARTYYQIKDRVFEFLPLLEQRKIFDEVTGHPVAWPEVTVIDEPETESNVVPFKDKVPF